MEDTYKMLQNSCNSIAKKIIDLADNGFYYKDENGDDIFYFEDAFDVKFTIDQNGDIFGVKICVAFGGPNIYIDTNEKAVCGYWGYDVVKSYLPSNICNNIIDSYSDFISFIPDYI